MKIAEQQFEKIKHVLPKPCGGVQIDHFTMINILLHVVENGGKWHDKKPVMKVATGNRN